MKFIMTDQTWISTIKTSFKFIFKRGFCRFLSFVSFDSAILIIVYLTSNLHIHVCEVRVHIVNHAQRDMFKKMFRRKFSSVSKYSLWSNQSTGKRCQAARKETILYDGNVWRHLAKVVKVYSRICSFYISIVSVRWLDL